MNDHRETDLFGNPVRPRKGLRGRPPVQLTEKDLDMLEAALTQGWSNQRTAEALGIGVSTLKRNFGPLLKSRHHLPDRLQLSLLATAVRKAQEGDMGALRQVRQILAENEAKLADARMRDVPADEPEGRLGKKEAAQRAAEQAASGENGGWGSLLKPGDYH